MLKKALRLGLDYLFFPERGALENKKPAGLSANVLIYAAFLVASLFFYWLKPWNFPDRYAPFPQESPGFLFWLRVMIWQPPLEIAWIVFLLGLTGLLEKGHLFLRLVEAAAWTAAPFILIVLYAQKNGIAKPFFVLGECGAFAFFIPFLKSWKRKDWIPIASFMIGLNVIGLVLLVPMIAGAALLSTRIFEGAQIIGGLWMLWSGMMGLRALKGMRLSRAFLAMLFSLFFQMALAFALYFIGVVPKEILKALLYA